MGKLSATAEAIRYYKLNANRGYEEWAKVSCTENYSCKTWYIKKSRTYWYEFSY